MTLTDTGPLVALIDADEPEHAACRQALRTISHPLLTTWPVVTEAMCLLGRSGGFAGPAALWRLVQSPRLEVAELSEAVVARSAALMEKYADLPMSLADATLVAVAEDRKLTRVFTLDADFAVYRRHGRRSFELIPS